MGRANAQRTRRARRDAGDCERFACIEQELTMARATGAFVRTLGAL